MTARRWGGGNTKKSDVAVVKELARKGDTRSWSSVPHKGVVVRTGDSPVRTHVPVDDPHSELSSTASEDRADVEGGRPTTPFAFRNERGAVVREDEPAIDEWVKDNPDLPSPRWYTVETPPPRPATVAGGSRVSTRAAAKARRDKKLPVSVAYQFSEPPPPTRPTTAAAGGGEAGGGMGREYRSDAIELEVALLEALKASGAEREGPCRIRRTVYSQLFDVVIGRVPTYAHLLKLIKAEYDSGDVLDSNRESLLREEKELAQTIAEDAKLQLRALANETAQLREGLTAATRAEEALKEEMDAKDREIRHLNDRLLKLNPLWLQQHSFYAKLKDMESELESTLETALGPREGEEASLPSDPNPPAGPDPRVAELENKVYQLETEIKLARKREAQAYSDLVKYQRKAAGIEDDGEGESDEDGSGVDSGMGGRGGGRGGGGDDDDEDDGFSSDGSLESFLYDSPDTSVTGMSASLVSVSSFVDA